MPAWLVWLILAGVFAGGEAVTGSFVLLMFAGGALAGAVTAALGGVFLAEIVVALIGSCKFEQRAESGAGSSQECPPECRRLRCPPLCTRIHPPAPSRR